MKHEFNEDVEDLFEKMIAVINNKDELSRTVMALTVKPEITVLPKVSKKIKFTEKELNNFIKFSSKSYVEKNVIRKELNCNNCKHDFKHSEVIRHADGKVTLKMTRGGCNSRICSNMVDFRDKKVCNEFEEYTQEFLDQQKDEYLSYLQLEQKLLPYIHRINGQLKYGKLHLLNEKYIYNWR